MSKSERDERVTDRRAFLKLAGLGTAASGAALVMGAEAQSAETAESQGSGYRETDHVKAYYAAARF